MDQDIPKLEVSNCQLITRSTSDGPVYRINHDKAAKFQWSEGFLEGLISHVSLKGEQLHHEYEVAKLLFDEGVSVPQPYGVFKLRKPSKQAWHSEFVKWFPAFVMEYIDGRPPSPKYIFQDKQRRVDELIKQEYDKVRKLGIRMLDAGHYEQTIWVPEEDRVYLIDFADWELPKSNKE